jgi:hypothetical protein
MVHSVAGAKRFCSSSAAPSAEQATLIAPEVPQKPASLRTRGETFATILANRQIKAGSTDNYSATGHGTPSTGVCKESGVNFPEGVT